MCVVTKIYSILLLLLLLLHISVTTTNGDLSTCITKRKDSSRQVVECKYLNKNNLSSIKEQMEVTDLIIKDCDWSAINFEDFKNFTQLLTLSIINCKTDCLKKQNKSNLVALITIQNVSIQYTQIEHIGERTFSFFPNIEYINLDCNEIEMVDKFSFDGLHKLQLVNLSNNKIENLPEGTIGVELFDLSSNPIKSSLRSYSFLLLQILPIYTLIITCIVGLFCMCSFYKDQRFFETIYELISWVKHCPVIIIDVVKNFFSSDTSHIKTINQIQYFTNKPLGKNVFEGRLLDTRIVAVKRSWCIESIWKISETKVLAELFKDGSSNKNVIAYVGRAEDEIYQYLALAPLCDMTLKDAIMEQEERVTQYLRAGRKSCLEQLANGLTFIHNHNIQHRDIKPSNILVLFTGPVARFIITDFDLGHIAGTTSNSKVSYGTIGWSAPELKRKQNRKKRKQKQPPRTYKVDIFSMGCVFYYALTQGKHPFGPINNMEECQNNIKIKKLPVLDDTKLVKQLANYRKEQAKDLIHMMIKIKCNPDERLFNVDHPFFLNDKEIVDFFSKIGNCFDNMKAESYARLREYLRAPTQTVFMGNWMEAIPNSEVKNDVGNKNGEDMCSLLKVVRDKITHIDRMIEIARKDRERGKTNTRSQKLVEIYKDKPGVAEYYNKLFPRLLIHTYYAKIWFDEENAVQT